MWGGWRCSGSAGGGGRGGGGGFFDAGKEKAERNRQDDDEDDEHGNCNGHERENGSTRFRKTPKRGCGPRKEEKDFL